MSSTTHRQGNTGAPLLQDVVDAALIASISPELRASIDQALASGRTKKQVLAGFQRMVGRHRTLAVLAVEAYLGAEQDGRLR